MTIWLEVLALAGITGIITRSYLLQGFRDRIKQQKIKYLLNCPQCTGFWVGVIYYLFMVFKWSDSPISILFDCLLWAGAVSLFSSATVTGLDYLSFLKTRVLNDIANDATSNILMNSTEAEESDEAKEPLEAEGNKDFS